MAGSLPSSLRSGVVLNRVAGWLSPQEFRVLEAICDTFFPSLRPPEDSSQALARYYHCSARDLHLPLLIAETLAAEAEGDLAAFQRFLALLSHPLTGLALVGRAQAFVSLPLEVREKYLLALAYSPLGPLRRAYQALKRMTCFLYFSLPDAQGKNPAWEALDYMPPPLEPVQEVRRLQPLSITADTELECDVVVIGSGAGGGVVAGELAQAGKNVIVLEKGGYYTEADFGQQEAHGIADLYLKRGLSTTKDLGIVIYAGSTLGGGTVVNWMTSFRAREDVLADWTRSSGLDIFTGSAFQKSYEAVEQRMQVNRDNSQHNRQNQLLFEAAKASGYSVGSIPRNGVDCQQRCGACGFGCRYGCKQSTLKTYLQDAYDHGARLLVHCSAEHILIEQGRAVGVVARIQNEQMATNYQVIVRAKVVVVAAGALHSPALLLRSGVENRHIGRHLHLHPNTPIAGIYDEKVQSWQGVMQSAYCDEFARLTGSYGYILEVPPGHPGMLGLAAPWPGAREFRRRMVEAGHVAAFLPIVRDRGEGHIALDRQSEPVVHYVPSVFDRRHLLHGMCTAARLHLEAGAREVFSLHSKPTSIARGVNGKVSARNWLDFVARLERHGMNPNRLILFSAHQMGTCRMGNDPANAVTDENGAVYGVQGLFVCDGSLFPSAPGVNPMLTIMALVHQCSQHIKATVA